MSASNRTKRIWLTVALAHVGLVLGGAFQMNWGGGILQRLSTVYGRISGSSSGYAFFAPGVDSQLRATFQVYDVAGKKFASVPLEQGKSHEADLRIGNIVGWFWKGNPERKQQRAMTASWAGKVFARYPKAAAVEVVLEEYRLPDMADYRAGQRPGWTRYYTAKFKKVADKT